MDYIIIVAGGKGLRMGTDIPKQFLPIGGKPVLMRTLERFREYSKELQMILVLPKAQQDYWHQLCEEYHFNVKYMLAGVRPFPSVDVICNCYKTAQEKKAVIPVIPVVETLRHITEGTKPRGEYRLVQTPQCFDIQLLKAANKQPYNDGFTDDASVVEAFGFDVTLVEGNRENIKITTPFDMTIAEALLQK